jgi:hypothetical protein
MFIGMIMMLSEALYESLLEPIKSGFFIAIAITICLLIFMMIRQKGSKKPYIWLLVPVSSFYNSFVFGLFVF